MKKANVLYDVSIFLHNFWLILITGHFASQTYFKLHWVYTQYIMYTVSLFLKGGHGGRGDKGEQGPKGQKVNPNGNFLKMHILCWEVTYQFYIPCNFWMFISNLCYGAFTFIFSMGYINYYNFPKIFLLPWLGANSVFIGSWFTSELGFHCCEFKKSGPLIILAWYLLE